MIYEDLTGFENLSGLKYRSAGYAIRQLHELGKEIPHCVTNDVNCFYGIVPSLRCAALPMTSFRFIGHSQ